jgi:catechol 2,3-dioxygenase-like lactoylglutathione lyase family enzyme
MTRLTEIARFTNKLDEMAAFYQQLLGKEPEVRAEGMAIFMLGEVKLFLHQAYQPADGELPPENHTAFTVEDVDLECERLAAAGLRIDVPPQEYYWGYSAYLRDPEGQMIELIQSTDQANE